MKSAKNTVTETMKTTQHPTGKNVYSTFDTRKAPSHEQHSRFDQETSCPALKFQQKGVPKKANAQGAINWSRPGTQVQAGKSSRFKQGFHLHHIFSIPSLLLYYYAHVQFSQVSGFSFQLRSPMQGANTSC